MQRPNRGTHLFTATLAVLTLLGSGFWVGRLVPRPRLPAPMAGQLFASPRPPLASNSALSSRSGDGESATGSPRTGTSVAAGAPATADRRLRHTPIVEVARSISPAVVSVGAERTTYVSDFDPFFRDFFAPYFHYPQRQKIPYLGSGFLIDPRGYILTNQHVIDRAERIFVTLSDGRELEARLLDADRFADVALLKVEGENLPFVVLGDSDDLMIGETVVAVGNPFGNYLQDPRPTVTAGVVSAVQRSFKPDTSSHRVYVDMIQTDAAINPGNSGGPLVTLDHKVVGMNTFIFSTRGGGNVGLGFAIPINRIKAIVDEILEHGRLRSLLVDFEAINLNPRLARQLDVNVAAGAVIRSMHRGGPGERAGLQVGDTIVRADGRPVTSAQDLVLYIAARQVGERIEFTLLRAGQQMTVRYLIEEAGERPSAAPRGRRI